MSREQDNPVAFRYDEKTGLAVPGGVIPATAIRKVYVDPTAIDVENGVTLVNVSFFGVDADFLEAQKAIPEPEAAQEETPEEEPKPARKTSKKKT